MLVRNEVHVGLGIVVGGIDNLGTLTAHQVEFFIKTEITVYREIRHAVGAGSGTMIDRHMTLLVMRRRGGRRLPGASRILPDPCVESAADVGEVTSDPVGVEQDGWIAANWA
jgi:hypothetical protein